MSRAVGAAGSKVFFHWVKAHDGHPENERCDELAKNAAKTPGRVVDKGYVANM